jgi:hypothetical protein
VEVFEALLFADASRSFFLRILFVARLSCCAVNRFEIENTLRFNSALNIYFFELRSSGIAYRDACDRLLQLGDGECCSEMVKFWADSQIENRIGAKPVYQCSELFDSIEQFFFAVNRHCDGSNPINEQELLRRNSVR